MWKMNAKIYMCKSCKMSVKISEINLQKGKRMTENCREIYFKFWETIEITLNLFYLIGKVNWRLSIRVLLQLSSAKKLSIDVFRVTQSAKKF